MEPITDIVVATLRNEIAEGLLAEGAPIRQELLAKRFATSRIPIRDALQRLQAEGLVDLQPNRGAFVRTLSAAELTEIFEIRQLLELDLLTRAAARLDRPTLDRARGIHSALGFERDSHQRTLLDISFHRTLYSPAQRPRQMEIIFHLRQQVTRFARIRAGLAEQTPTFQLDHEAILRALELRQTDAARAALAAHLQRAQTLALANQAQAQIEATEQREKAKEEKSNP